MFTTCKRKRGEAGVHAALKSSSEAPTSIFWYAGNIPYSSKEQSATGGNLGNVWWLVPRCQRAREGRQRQRHNVA